ncbi:DEKNAAC104248 [Brettanomyces naardenensis]|uniref:DEKNAAC104248 n=1 Tax=Brettanomyces naardenensis TaxID=13370 RepID=A0A448YPZ2_BRENA|nr:DEKNAAC104248 [Brettanomyces naardenensis]
MLNFVLLVVIVFLINKFLTRQATKATAKPIDPSMSNITPITSEAQFKEVVSASNLVVVDFFATWCGPCKMLAPMLEKFAQEYTTAKFYNVDVDQLPNVAASNDVSSMPTLLFFKGGELVGKVIGANPGAVKANLAKLA